MRVLVLDDTDRLSPIWRAGALISRANVVVRASSWADAYDALEPLAGVRMLQVWGHGQAGAPLIDGRPVDLQQLGHALHAPTDGVVWFRSCDVFQGARGRSFALEAVRQLGCGVVGHTRVVSAPWPTHQSGGYGLRPGELPHWPIDDEGGSNPFARNTCLVTRMTVPPGWWQ